MVKFEILRTGEIKHACSLETKGDKVFVRYSQNGKEYRYNADNLRILPIDENADNHVTVYSFERKCWKCGKTTEIVTYIKFYDNADDDVTFPWDKNRLLKCQDLSAHLAYPEIEFYGLHVLGDLEKYDNILIKNFPEKIREEYSKTVDEVYPMNVCENCGAKQGRFFVYKTINEIVKAMQPIKIKKEIDF